MKGATVDTMALAVEGSALMLIGVSRQYKESSNCRMEAQYGLQKKKPLIPLMLTEGYEADGWLGLVLGTSMWYALYGGVLETESAFDDRMTALCREIGSRGRGDGIAWGSMGAAPAEPEPTPQPPMASSPAEEDVAASAQVERRVLLQQELYSLKLGALSRRAMAAGVDGDALDRAEADDQVDGKGNADPWAAIIDLILEATFPEQ
jgi:hypothetical protein